MRTLLCCVLFAPFLALGACTVSKSSVLLDAGRDGGVGVDAGADGGAAMDAGSDGGAAMDAGADGGPGMDAGADGGAGMDAGTDAGCIPPPCAAPPMGCHYEGGSMCTCGTLVCTCTGPGPGLPCCVTDADCGSGGAQHCVGEICSPGGPSAGVCELDASIGKCWEDADCTGGMYCVGARICPCGTNCLVADKPGTCSAQPDCRTIGCGVGFDCCSNTGLCYNPACLACCM